MLVARFVAVLTAILVITLTLGHFARPECEAVARRFVADYGYAGMALGTLLADGFHFPIPPQFYMLLAVASGTPVPQSFGAIAAASVVAGGLGYGAAGFVARHRWVQRRTEPLRALFDRAFQRFGIRAAIFSSLLPLPYSVLCYLAGLNRLPRRFLLLLCLCRVPKLAGFYWLVYLGFRPG